ncbi:MATE family efflux transporter [bacterium (Candidatus Blackallbacteria) CG17_big_fil_post_rev_8_21_14_2_50_48_46]|uniref:Multidrug-efflux transporter n=1 Tax=bacterium (Candidatus Blackallbacteria) CG17_big_fil_post_rev_8_21_14_2_50_48_46 TaxID=2014261 RepID=A0A2M7FYP0_9BACT|nr:MAG: MATE family efflux transporter [bacterium (Candidatus Blackallbacteria) CG18_big_fil_WC_8_21_14_2_50_49_26]PIW14467.1 MAG: MATE family efflux transporter [bacterium (Candidatus Blackallbacteria) CG17_big_fil_post_rev_8_21_14_2_50_48_46]PIW47153.1 MAG: MATE family efflux transporter [bacterium (Candidatus Blackallbacteria) CG13_big_fil_rev_8_21_14_2_50_49_14]
MSTSALRFPDQARRQKILQLSLPIIGGMVSQNILNLVDTAMVGSLGNQALAAVGIGSFANWMAMAFITGLSAGVQAMAARRMGESKEGEMAIPLNGGLLLAFALAAPWSLLLFFLAPLLFPFLNPDPAVAIHGVPYLQARLLGMVAVAMNFSFRGYWNGINYSGVYMRTLIVMHLANIVLSYLLIFGVLGLPALGTAGAGIGTTLATFLGTALYFIEALRVARKNGFLKGLPRGETLVTMLRLAVPAGIQQLFFSAGMTSFFWIVGRVGTAELAASNVLVNLLLVAILPGMAFGMACASLVGQALGRSDPEDARLWGWEVSWIACLSVGMLSLPAVFFPDMILGLFIHDPHTLALARFPLQLVALTMALDTLGSVLMQALLGAGDSRRVMLVSVGFQWGLYLPLLFVLTQIGLLGLTGIWVLQMGYRAIQTLVFTRLWQAGHWQKIRV